MRIIESNLKEICRRKDLSLSDVASRMGTTPSNLLSSVQGNPTISKLEDIASALQVNVTELLSQSPEIASGLVFIDGQTYQVCTPTQSTLQVPFYNRFDRLRHEVAEFIRSGISMGVAASMFGIVGTTEQFCLSYDHQNEVFTLSLCYAGGKTLTFFFDKLEYCVWENLDSTTIADDEVNNCNPIWNLDSVIQEILNDIEDAVPTQLAK